MNSIVAILFAWILDVILGDPRWLPHPVRAIGGMIKKGEPLVRKIIKNQYFAGIVFVLIITSFVGVVSFFIVYKTNFNLFVSGFLIYTTISIKDLKCEAMLVYNALEKADITQARKNLSMIVGRDTNCLNETEIIRATVETIAENTVDGIIAPLFYAFIGGAPLALIYKAVNTLDSMVGYKNKKYKKFGWASAKIDDILNFVPARVGAVILPFAGLFSGKSGLSSLKTVLRDGKKNPSPNSGIPEAAFAGALGVRLGGMNFYDSQSTLKPFIGDSIEPLKLKHIKESLSIAYISSFLCLITGVIIFL